MLDGTERSLILRPAGLRDKEALAAIFTKLSQITPNTEEMTQRHLIDLLKSDHPWMKLTVAERDGHVVGCIGLTGGMRQRFGDVQIISIEALYVEPASRGQGIGKALIDRARLSAMAQGAGQLVLRDGRQNMRAQTLISFGFTPTPKMKTRYVMELY